MVVSSVFQIGIKEQKSNKLQPSIICVCVCKHLLLLELGGSFPTICHLLHFFVISFVRFILLRLAFNTSSHAILSFPLPWVSSTRISWHVFIYHPYALNDPSNHISSTSIYSSLYSVILSAHMHHILYAHWHFSPRVCLLYFFPAYAHPLFWMPISCFHATLHFIHKHPAVYC